MPYFDRGQGGLVAEAVRRGGFDAGIEQVIAAVLVSPEFLYRGVQTPERRRRQRAFPLSDLELASRLSFFLWSQGPDDALLDVAAAGKLKDPGVLRAQALRMLKDPRASSLVRNFALKWLDLDSLNEAEPDPNLFPTFNGQLRQDLKAELESFVASVLLEDRNVGDLLTADHTFLNERLARHYGITSVLGPQFRRVTLADSRRWGLLGKGAMLLRTSYGNRTSPVLRGAWVMGKLMGTPPTPPPPDVDTDLSTPKGEAPKTLRARLESHRAKPGCRQCHDVIDPIGLALENFDAIGRWRDVDEEAKAPIDARTVLPDGRPVDGPGPAAPGALRGPGPVRARPHREADDVRGGTEARVLRHAAGPRGRAPGRGTGLPAVGDRVRHRDERCLPHAGRLRRGHQGELTMFLTKKHLSRRTVLRGAGVTLALPLLDAMVPAATALAQTAAAPKLRMGFFYIPHGAIMGNTSHGPQMDRWTPSGAGADFKLSPILKSLEPYKRYVTSFGNLQNRAMVGGVHSLAPATWLSGMKPDRASAGASMSATLDQVVAQRIGQDTTMPSLELAAETTQQAAACSGSACFYNTTLSFRDEHSPLPMEYNPRKVFAQLFGEGDTPEERARDREPDQEPAGPHHRPHARAAAGSGCRRSRGAGQLPGDGA